MGSSSPTRGTRCGAASRATCCSRSRRSDAVPEARLRVDAVMSEIERDVRTRLRRHLIKRGGAADYQDEELFDAVHSVLARAVDQRNLDATLLPELLDSDIEWRLQTHLSLSTHRPTVGRFILFAKRR